MWVKSQTCYKSQFGSLSPCEALRQVVTQHDVLIVAKPMLVPWSLTSQPQNKAFFFRNHPESGVLLQQWKIGWVHLTKDALVPSKVMVYHCSFCSTDQENDAVQRIKQTMLILAHLSLFCCISVSWTFFSMVTALPLVRLSASESSLIKAQAD